MSARDKAGLGYGDQMNKGVLSYENEVFQSVFVSRTSDIEDSPVNDRYAEGMHAVPPPITRIYIPSGPDKEIDDSQFTYGLKQSKPSESDARSSDFNTCESNCSEETHESMPEPVVNEPKVVSQPKVWSDAPIIEEYESDSEDEHSPKPDKKDCSGLMAEKLGLGYGFTKKACFVCGSFSHLIRDCDFHEKRMAKQAELNNRMTVLTRTGKIQVNTTRTSGTNTVNTARTSGTNTVNTARHNFNRQAVPTNAARKVNTVKPIVNNARPKAGFHKTLSPFRKPFNRTTTLRTNFSYQKVNTAEVNAVSAVGGKRETAVKPSAGLSTKSFTEQRDSLLLLEEVKDFNLFSVSQMCDKKNKVLFTDTECLVLSPEFKLPDENKVLLRIPRQNNMYSFNLENIVPSGGLACLIAKAIIDESNKWHRRLGHVNFKNLNKLVKGNLVRGKGPTWLFDLDYLTDSMNYQPVRSENQANKHAGIKEANHSIGTEDNIDAGNSEIEAESAQDYFVLLIWSSYTLTVKSSKAKNVAAKASSTNTVNTASTPVSTTSPYGGLSFTDTDQDDSKIPALEDMYDHPTNGIFTNASYDDEGAVADFTNLETIVNVSPIPTSRINSIHPSTLILGDPNSAVQTRSKVTKSSGAYAFKISEALEDESWVDAMQEELLQFKIQKV
ncbi:putative ribonuclease H-like domain-containing protein [Tanacetum coccineum]